MLCHICERREMKNGRIKETDDRQKKPRDIGGVIVIVLANGVKVRGFKPSRGRWIF
jgi:hypothetical protein